MNLQNQIRQKFVDGIINGAFAPGMKLPSSRKLAVQLDVARNTVVAAYQQLIADGYLVSRQRSGIFVNEQMLEARVARDLPNWSRYPYPFIDGKFDSTLFPLAEWREASRWIAIGGSVLVIILSTRLGRLKPVSIAILITAISTWALHYSHVNPDSWFSSVFWLAIVVIAVTWAFTISYLLSMCAEFDKTGQMAALGGFASKMGLASGPFFAAYVVGENNYALIITASTIALILCMFVVVIPSRTLDAVEKR
jgi:DNA-binding transcriptional regulator YhcF (GntR family)